MLLRGPAISPVRIGEASGGVANEMSGYAIRAHELTKRYGATLALDALRLAVEPGEVYGYLGPNGAGKTTTIRLLLGLHRPSGGCAELFGIDARRSSPRRHREHSLPPRSIDGDLVFACAGRSRYAGHPPVTRAFLVWRHGERA